MKRASAASRRRTLVSPTGRGDRRKAARRAGAAGATGVERFDNYDSWTAMRLQTGGKGFCAALTCRIQANYPWKIKTFEQNDKPFRGASSLKENDRAWDGVTGGNRVKDNRDNQARRLCERGEDLGTSAAVRTC